MDRHTPNKNVINPKDFLKKEETKVNKFNNALAVAITKGVGSMWSAYIFALLSLLSLPAILVTINPAFKVAFPKWIITTSMITLIAWISQNFLQLVLLPVIMVGQNVIQDQQDAKAATDHNTLTYLANLQEEQMKELEAIKDRLSQL
jgi:uncharacterized membrane protein YhaH (DUF805 family)